jgi:hypothetical protein
MPYVALCGMEIGAIAASDRGSQTGIVPFLRAVGLRKSFGKTQALRGGEMTVRAGAIAAVMGPSGSGRTSRSTHARRFPTFSRRRVGRCSTCSSRTPSSSWIASTANRSATCSIVVFLLQRSMRHHRRHQPAAGPGSLHHGSSQSAVVDGFFMMFKPLQRGERTIVVPGPAPSDTTRRTRTLDRRLRAAVVIRSGVQAEETWLPNRWMGRPRR